MKPNLATLLLASLLLLTSAARASTTWYVNGVSGSDANSCLSPGTACQTIGHAISLASSGDNIIVAPAIYKERLTITISLNIAGSGAAETIIDGGHFGTVIYLPNSSAEIALSGLTVRNGYGHDTYPGGIDNNGALTINKSVIRKNESRGGVARGGGIFNGGSLTINDTTLELNVVVGGCRTCSGNGGAINNTGALYINNSTVINNSAPAYGGGIASFTGSVTINSSNISRNSGLWGGGIYLSGPAIINNSTFYGNNAQYVGGGIVLSGEEDFILVLSNSTLSGNSATYGGGDIDNYYVGTAILQNTIVANSLSGGNCGGLDPITSNGYNLSSDGSCNFTGPGDLNNTDPMLGPLQHNGGPTQTMALPSGSPAIDAGNPAGCTDGQGNLLKTDQRGKPRPDKEDTGGCDMGAYESQSD